MKDLQIWFNSPRPFLILAPMAGYTESPFRRLIRDIEPSTILVSELVSAEALRRGSEKTMRMIDFAPEEKGYYGVQLFGGETDAFIEAGKIVQDMGVDFVDLNLGCPSPKVVGSGYGSALLQNPKQTAKMIEALASSLDIPLTVKMRLGFYSDENLVQTALDFENAGIQALAIHGRTTKQKFSGQAQWEKIYEVKNHLSIPVIGNGDIVSAKIAEQRLKNLDGVMIGRASLQNPWIFRQVREIFEGKPISSKPSLPEQLTFFRKHAYLATDFKNEKWAMIELRKHFSHFCKGFRNASRFREKLIRVESISQMEAIFDDILELEETP